METILLAMLVFGAAVLALCLGTLLGGRRIAGSCGGLNNLPGIQSDCGGACRRPGGVCPKKAASEAARRAAGQT
jgi:hypothetical protein